MPSCPRAASAYNLSAKLPVAAMLCSLRIRLTKFHYLSVSGKAVGLIRRPGGKVLGSGLLIYEMLLILRLPPSLLYKLAYMCARPLSLFLRQPLLSQLLSPLSYPFYLNASHPDQIYHGLWTFLAYPF